MRKHLRLRSGDRDHGRAPTRPGGAAGRRPDRPARAAGRRPDRPARRIGSRWRRHRWQITVVVAVAAAVCGLIGVGQDAPGSSVPDRAYGTLQLLSLAYIPVDGRTIPLALQIARFVLPLTLAWAGLQAVAALFVQEVARLRVRVFYRDHLVVCGVGRSGLSFAVSFWESGVPVVAVDAAPSEAAVEECRARSIPLIVGDASERLVLDRSRAARARWAVVTCGDDGRNAEVALALRAAPGPGRVRCFVHIGDDQLCGLLEETVFLSADATRVEYFNVTRSGPQALLAAHGFGPERPDAPGLRVVIAGDSRIAADLAVEAARRWHVTGPASGELVLMLASRTATSVIAGLRSRAPAIGRRCRLEPLDLDPADEDLPLDARGARIAFVCFDDDATALRATLRLRRRLPPSVPVVTCTTGRSSAVTQLLRDGGTDLLPNVSSFEMAERVCTPATLLDGTGEAVARAFHAAYVERELAAGGEAGSPSLRPWDELAPTLQRSNRDLAADIGRKLATIGCEIELMRDWDQPVLELSTAEIAVLAPMEHERWSDDRRRDGWTPGPVRDVDRRLHPDLVPWAELTEPVRDKDREAVRVIPRILATYAGFAVIRTRHGERPPPAIP